MEVQNEIAKVAEEILEKIQAAWKEMKTLNIMVFGKTGVGKSTLINQMFQKPLAEVGIGKPVTNDIRKYEVENFPLGIYDTPGLELSGENALDSLLKQAKSKIEEGYRSGDISKAIHCIWYCVNVSSSRFETAEMDFIRRLSAETADLHIPIILVLTKAFSKADARQMKEAIEKENLEVAQIVPVLAEEYVIDDEYTAKPYGLKTLTEATEQVIPDAVKKTLVMVQKADLAMKDRKAHAVVTTSVAAAAAVGAVPIPFSDAVLLVPAEISMLAGITAVYGLEVNKSTLTAVISATIGTAGATILGKTVVSGLLKLIPGAGHVVGGAISAGVAAAITAALGETYIRVMHLVARGEMDLADLETEKGKKKIAEIFHRMMKRKRNEKGEPLKKDEEFSE